MSKTVMVELSEQELRYIANDLISYLWDIKSRVIGEKAYNRSVYNNDGITPAQEKELKARGVYDRLDLLKRIEEAREKNFPDHTTNG